MTTLETSPDNTLIDTFTDLFGAKGQHIVNQSFLRKAYKDVDVNNFAYHLDLAGVDPKSSGLLTSALEFKLTHQPEFKENFDKVFNDVGITETNAISKYIKQYPFPDQFIYDLHEDTIPAGNIKQVLKGLYKKVSYWYTITPNFTKYIEKPLESDNNITKTHKSKSSIFSDSPPVDDFGSTLFKDAIHSLHPSSMQPALDFIDDLVQNSKFQGYLQTSAQNIKRHNTGLIKEKLSKTLQSCPELQRFVGIRPMKRNTVSPRGPDYEHTPPDFFRDPIRPVVFLAQVAMFEKYFPDVRKYSDNEEVQECLKNAYEIFTAHHSDESKKNVFMFLGPAGTGKSYFNSLLIAYVISRQIPITFVKSPSSSRDSQIFGSWSIDNYVDDNTTQSQSVGIYVCTEEKAKSEYRVYVDELKRHLKTFSGDRRVFIIDPLEVHTNHNIRESYGTSYIHELYRDDMNKIDHVFYSSHSTPRFNTYQEKAGLRPLINQFPNYTFFNMSFCHSTLHTIFTTALSAWRDNDDELKRYSWRLEACKYICAPTIRNYLQAIYDTEFEEYISDEIRYILDKPTLSQNYLCQIIKTIDATPCVYLQPFIWDSIIHEFNPDYYDYHILNSVKSMTGKASTYLTPFLKSHGVYCFLEMDVPKDPGDIAEEIAIRSITQRALSIGLKPKIDDIQIDYCLSIDDGDLLKFREETLQYGHIDTIEEIKNKNKQLLSKYLCDMRDISLYQIAKGGSSLIMMREKCPAIDFVHIYQKGNITHIRPISCKKSSIDTCEYDLDQQTFDLMRKFLELPSKPSLMFNYEPIAVYNPCGGNNNSGHHQSKYLSIQGLLGVDSTHVEKQLAQYEETEAQQASQEKYAYGPPRRRSPRLAELEALLNQ